MLASCVLIEWIQRNTTKIHHTHYYRYVYKTELVTHFFNAYNSHRSQSSKYYMLICSLPSLVCKSSWPPPYHPLVSDGSATWILYYSSNGCLFPPAPPEGTQKPSSLRSKVRERRERLEQRERLLSVLTAPEVSNFLSTPHVSVPCRNRILFHCVFQLRRISELPLTAVLKRAV